MATATRLVSVVQHGCIMHRQHTPRPAEERVDGHVEDECDEHGGQHDRGGAEGLQGEQYDEEELHRVE